MKEEDTDNEEKDRTGVLQPFHTYEQRGAERQPRGWQLVLAARRVRAARGEQVPENEPSIIPLHREDQTTN